MITCVIAKNKDPLSVVKQGLENAKLNNYDVVIIDTAGRLHIDNELMNEVKNISSLSNPHEILYVADSMTVKDAVNSAMEFNKLLSRAIAFYGESENKKIESSHSKVQQHKINIKDYLR